MYGVLLNLFERIIEHVENTLILASRGSHSSSEALARIAVESCINFRYILKEHTFERFEAYLEHYFESVKGQIDKWEKEVNKLPPALAIPHQKGIALRKEYYNKTKSYMNIANQQMKKLLQTSHHEEWPKTIFNRFEDLDLTLDYRTVYGRLSSEVHNDAEETVRHFIFSTIDDTQTKQIMQRESEGYTLFMAAYACDLFIESAIKYAEKIELNAILPILKSVNQTVINYLTEASKEAAIGLNS